MKNIKIAVIGCGYWGKNLVRNFYELGYLAAVCDANGEAALNLSTQYQVPIMTADEIWQSKEINAIVIAVPAEKHAIVAEAALNAGKHVFVEKPLALDVNQAIALAQLAEQKKRILMVGHLLQYHPAFLKLQELVHSNQLGELRYVYSHRLDFGKFFYPESAMWNFAPHDLSMILSLLQMMPESLHSQASAYLNPQVADITTTHLHFPNGVSAHVFVSWLNPLKEQRLVVVGSKAMAVFDDVQPWSDKLKIYPHQVNWVNDFPVSEKAEAINVEISQAEPLRNECQHFIDCIEKNLQPKTDGAEAVAVLQVISAADESIRTGNSIVLQQFNQKPVSYPTQDNMTETTPPQTA